MSEDNSNTAPSSGIEPGVRRITVIGESRSLPKPLTPTVIGVPMEKSPQVIKPTVIVQVKETPRIPTTIGTRIGIEKMVQTPPLKATTISIITAPAVINTQKVDKPSVIPGVIRKGIDVSVQDLEKIFPGNSRAVLNQVMQILKNTIPETLKTVACSQWGQHSQIKYQKLVDESLQIYSEGKSRDGTEHLRRLYTILEGLLAVLQDQGSKGLKFWDKKKTSWDKFQEVQSELNSLRQYLGQILPTLRQQQTRIEEISREALGLIEEIDAYSIAAQYVADTLGPGNELSDHLVTQGMSLTKAIAQIQEGNILRDAHGRAIDSLADRIQDGVLVTLPGWIERFSLLTSNPSIHETDNYSLRQSLEDLVTKLK